VTETIREAIVTMLREMQYDVPDDAGSMALGPEGLDLESLAVAELAVRIEDQYGVRFGEEEATGARAMTIDEFVAIVADRVEAESAHADRVG
jgi:acyl carrier protein